MVDGAAVDMVPLLELQIMAVPAVDKVVEGVPVLVDNFSVVGWLGAVYKERCLPLVVPGHSGKAFEHCLP